MEKLLVALIAIAILWLGVMLEQGHRNRVRRQWRQLRLKPEEGES